MGNAPNAKARRESGMIKLPLFQLKRQRANSQTSLFCRTLHIRRDGHLWKRFFAALRIYEFLISRSDRSKSGALRGSRDRYRLHAPGSLRVASACEAVRDPSTSFALLTSVRMTMTARESKNSQAVRMTDTERRPFSVILNEGCRSEESLTTVAT